MRAWIALLATAVLPNENKDLFELFKVPINADGFLVEAHAKLRPVDFGADGAFSGTLEIPASVSSPSSSADHAGRRPLGDQSL